MKVICGTMTKLVEGTLTWETTNIEANARVDMAQTEIEAIIKDGARYIIGRLKNLEETKPELFKIHVR